MNTQHPQQLCMIGLGRMGANIVRRIVGDGHTSVVFDVNANAVEELAGDGIVGASSLADMISKAPAPRAVWLMLPAALTDAVVDELAELLEPDDVIIDGGNSFYRDDVARAQRLAGRSIHYVDCGTSGGVWGRERGYSLMIGGESEVVARLDSLFASIAPGPDASSVTPGRNHATTASNGYLHCGPVGAGHFVKMVHNGIEYGMMASIGEGLNILRHANVGQETLTTDAETAPLRDPEYYVYDFNLADVAEVWRHGSVISSWLMDLTADALARSPQLEEYAGRVSDSGEARWTVDAAIDESVPAPVIAAALFQRFDSQSRGEFAAKVLSAMRTEFGGHAEKTS